MINSPRAFSLNIATFSARLRLIYGLFRIFASDGLHLIFVELKKFKPQTYAEKKMQMLWLRFLTEINDETREVPAELLENAEVSEALEIVERAAFDDAEMRAYDKFWDNVSVQKTLDNARKREINAVKREAEKAKAEAEEAKAKLKQEKFDTARKLKAMNVMTTEQIAEVTGLTAEEIEGL